MTRGSLPCGVGAVEADAVDAGDGQCRAQRYAFPLSVGKNCSIRRIFAWGSATWGSCSSNTVGTSPMPWRPQCRTDRRE